MTGRQGTGDRGRFSVSFFSNKKQNHRKDDSDFVEHRGVEPLFRILSLRSGLCCRIDPLLASVDLLTSTMRMIS